MTSLFDPLRIGALTLKNRILMAPLTRSRAGESRVPNALMAQYYAQRAGAGLILSEATSVTPMGVGYADTPGIWNDAQQDGWSEVTKAVHDADGLIFLQLWHVGRISDPMFLDGQTPVAPSAITPAGTVSLVRPKKPYVKPRALGTDEIPGIIDAYRQAAVRAKAAGFDGVEIHGANGYLVEQFLYESTNRRTDDYGGPIENRIRILNEIVDAVSQVWGADRVGVHLSPRGDQHDLNDSDRKALFTRVAAEMAARGIAFLCLREHLADDNLLDDIKAAFGGVVILNEQLTPDSARQVVGSGRADAVAFGRDFISTPDLPGRIRNGQPFNQLDPDTLYVGGAKGYVDYPSLQDA